MIWKIEQLSETVSKIRVQYDAVGGWEFRILLSSDRHIDSVYSDHLLQKKHLEIAKKNGWPVIDLGDFFDSMQGKFDPRRSRISRPDMSDKEEYFDSLVDYAERFVNRYTEQFAIMGIGNHEASALKHSETHLLKRLIKRMNQAGSPAVMGGFSGWIKIMFETEVGRRKTINIRYTHGAGGAAPVTKGVIKTNRRGIVYPDANIVISGHTHDTWVFPIPRERINEAGALFIDEQLHISIPSYKDETTGNPTGFGVEKEFSPKTTGAIWLKFWYDRDRLIKYDAIRAM